ncbi:MAG TPA: CAP domain-containing protein [Baekduia sp.]|nr:CAP domain-containing protein [Baekduia sp.]
MKTLRRFAFVIACVAATVPATASAANPSAKRIIAKFNKVRADHGLPMLRETASLDRSARGVARNLIRTQRFTHGAGAPTGFRHSGEILARRSGLRSEPALTLRQWLASPPHAALILDPSFRYVGASPAKGKFGGKATTIWVAHFGAN